MKTARTYAKPLSSLIRSGFAGNGLEVKMVPPQAGGSADPLVEGISYDSRVVRKGDAFFCLPGQKHDGYEFAAEAIDRGACCIFTEKSASQPEKVPVVAVSDIRQAQGILSSRFFDDPSSKLRLIGVTGTNGKTTTTHLVEHMFAHAGRKVGLIGTLGARWGSGEDETYIEAKHTTPQASDLQALLAQMVEEGVTHVAMEVSSHALALKRVSGCSFAVGCLTNVTQDHLDFHKTMENYWRAKALLFQELANSERPDRAAIVNLDDPLTHEFIKAATPERSAQTGSPSVLKYSWSDASADIHVLDSHFDFTGSQLSLATPGGAMDLKLHLNGMFNAYNVMAALLICLHEGVDPAVCKNALEQFQGVSGRFQSVKLCDEQPLCIVDYAHTPDGLDNVLRAARKIVPDSGKLIVVFGCGGDRDSSKRPQMGEIAEQKADLVYVTSDNPRSEDPQQIIADILAGIRRMRDIQVEADRSRAIRSAILNASDSDVVVVAGKGHETYQILADRTIEFDDRLVVKEALSERARLT